MNLLLVSLMSSSRMNLQKENNTIEKSMTVPIETKTKDDATIDTSWINKDKKSIYDRFVSHK